MGNTQEHNIEQQKIRAEETCKTIVEGRAWQLGCCGTHWCAAGASVMLTLPSQAARASRLGVIRAPWKAA